jgi:hypothetical protein
MAHDPTGQFAHNQRKTTANMANDCLRHAETPVSLVRRISGAEDVVGIERLVDLGEPFGTVGGAAAAAFVER